MTFQSGSGLVEAASATHPARAGSIAVLVLTGVMTLFAAELPRHAPLENSRPQGTFELIIEGNSIALRSNGGSLVEILEKIGREKEIEIVAAHADPLPVEAAYPSISLESLIERFSHYVDIAYVVGPSETEDRKITKIMVFPRGGGPARAEPAPLSGAKQPARPAVSFDPMQHLR